MKRSTSFPPGKVTVESRSDHIVRIRLGHGNGPGNKELGYRLLSALKKGLDKESLKFKIAGVSEFTRKVLLACAKIRFGEVRTYGQIAEGIGKPGGARAVGQVMARNPLPFLIPCHRVVRKGLFLGGFAGGPEWKAFLLGCEGWSFEGKGTRRRLKQTERKRFG